MSMSNAIFLSGWAHSADEMRLFSANVDGIDNTHSFSPKDLLEAGRGAAHGSIGASVYAYGLEACMQEISGACVVVGWSMGAMIMLEAAAKLGTSASKMVCIAGTPKFCMGDGWGFGVPSANVRALSMGLRAAPKRTMRRFMDDLYYPNEVPDDIDATVKESLDQGADVLQHGLEYLMDTDLRNDVTEIRVPTMLIHGVHDRLMPVTAGRELSKLVDSHSYMEIDNAGHKLPELIAGATEQINKFISE